MRGLILIVWGYAGMALGERPDRLLADFEAERYGTWRAEGEAFGPGPAQGTLPGQMAVSGYRGKRLVNSYFKGDRSTGTLTSPPFVIDRNYLVFLIGGGGVDGVSMQLIVEGKAVLTAQGPNTQPGGSEALEPAFWDLQAWQGKEGTLKIVDQAKGGWGHINVDHLILSDTQPSVPLRQWKRDFTTQKRWLLLPVKNGAQKRHVELLSDGVAVRSFTIELGDVQSDWMAPLDVGAWRGKPLTIRIDRCNQEPKLEWTDEVMATCDLYNEAERPQFHFSPKYGWNNDPNGLCFYQGEYHLFFQHNPYGRSWGNMHWGHAVSKDLIQWREVGEALYPDALGTMYSGSAVVDRKNTSGFGKGEKPPLVLIYTAAGRRMSQNIASSTDGRVFTKYDGNPVIPQRGEGDRDPKVFWHEGTRHWIMALYVGRENGHTIELFRSEDLKAWEPLSVIAGDGKGKGSFLYECPDFFELPVEGSSESRWVLFAADGQYAVGTFDGKTFSPEASRLRGHFGTDYYAAQTFSDLPDGRRIIMGWFRIPGGVSFNQGMTLPHALGLKQTGQRIRLTHTPIQELASLRSSEVRFTSAEELSGFQAELMELRLDIEPSEDARIKLEMRGVPIVYDCQKQEITIQGHAAPLDLQAGRLKLIVYLDRVGMELFSGDGLFYASRAVVPAKDTRETKLLVERGQIRRVQGCAYALKSIWR